MHALCPAPPDLGPAPAPSPGRGAGGRPAPALEEAPSLGSAAPGVSRAIGAQPPPGEATRWPPRRPGTEAQPAPGPGRAPGARGKGARPPNPEKGRGTHLRLPPRPPSAPPPLPAQSRPEGRGRACSGGRLDAPDPATRVPGPRGPPTADRRRAQSARRPGRGRPRGGPWNPEAPAARAPQPLRRRVPGKARRGPRVPLATPEVAACGAESPAPGPRAAGAHQRRPDVGAGVWGGRWGGSTSSRRPFGVPHHPHPTPQMP